ncbi:Cell polarity protein [Rhodotorula toruloides ATCC 204091]|uniref:Cell polarity protein n=1 Tax=Rhodotorula toruloides TaxID=5286 RepID=A0A0K3CK10_RHOTO|nr:Cell polarity protein [Rhodotorula toruloides ATCC 204091]KAK4332303.1 Cell polarity protein [Rhodotorula toruloides]PRQ72595.1 cell polarity protein [Rhodotorula toruloides]
MSFRGAQGGPRPQNPPAPGPAPQDAYPYRQQPPQQPGAGPPPPSQQQQPRPAPQPPTAVQVPAGGSANKPPALTLEQSKQVARTHYTALKGWLHEQGALAGGSTRSNAREKLTRLTRQQFQELSTDVYDELMRRIEDSNSGQPGQQPFLAVRPDFHPKRNQARQKLATLPLLRFRDLASDVYFELDRRYPEFADEDNASLPYSTPTGGYSSPISRADSLTSTNAKPGPSSISSPPPTADRRAPTPTSAAASPALSSAHIPPPITVPAGNDVVVPNKSTMVVEDPSPSPSIHRGPSQPSSGPTSPADPAHALTSSANIPPASVSSTSGGFNYGSGGGPASASLRSPPLSGHEDRGMQSLQSSAGPGSGLNRASEASSVGTNGRFFGGYAGSQAGASEAVRRSWEGEPLDKIRSSYEYKLTMLQNRVSELERENEELKASREDGDRWEGERRQLEQRLDEQSSRLRSLQQENETLRSSASRSPTSSASDAQLRTRLHEAEELASELRGEVSSLVDEIRQVSERADELQAEVEREKEGREKAEGEAKTWKERWQAVKLELRNVKATSQLFSSSISVDADYMPASSDGLLNDTSVAAFQTSIDDLLQAARSKEPTSILPAARAVVNACEKIDVDVQAIPHSRLASLPPSDQDLVESLKAKINATLSNLMTAVKNHATSFGVSPVSLVDAAASHLATTVVELVRILKIRRTTGGSSGRTRDSLDPSAAFGGGSFRNGGPSFAREPMPPLHEDAQAQGEDDTISIPVPSSSSPAPPAPPAKERAVSPTPSQVERKDKGYLSGGMSSLLGGGSVKHALEAIGISGNKRNSVDTLASEAKGKERESGTTAMSMATDSTHSFASPQQQSHDRYGHEDRQEYASPQQYDQRQPSFESSRSAASPALSHPQYERSPSFQDQHQGNLPYDERGPSFEYGSQSQGRPSSEFGYNGQQQPYHYQDQQYGGGDNAYGGEDHGAGGYGPSSPGMRGHERDPEELRSYIENQTEAIVHSIQSLLSAIRSGAQSSELNENLTQIITIVSSIVAISQEALPDHARDEGDAILQDLTTHCDKLSEMQSQAAGAGPDAFTKQTKQAMAAASFGVAKSLKQLSLFLFPSESGI